MPGTTTHGYPYAVPDDALVNWPATSKALADKLEAVNGIAFAGTAVKVSPGVFRFTHNLGVAPRAWFATWRQGSIQSTPVIVHSSTVGSTTTVDFFVWQNGQPLDSPSFACYVMVFP